MAKNRHIRLNAVVKLGKTQIIIKQTSMLTRIISKKNFKIKNSFGFDKL